MLLHTEVMAQHLLVTMDARGRRLSGLIDFEPAMRGEREYEFAAVGVFVAQGDARFLHRYSHLAGWLRRLPEPAEPTLNGLADRWFATE